LQSRSHVDVDSGASALSAAILIAVRQRRYNRMTMGISETAAPPLSARATAAIRRAIALIRYGEVARYGVVTVVGYAILYLGAYLLIERAGIAPVVAYMLLLTCLYAAVYVSYTLYVFRERFTTETLRRFIVALVFMWAVNNAFFYLLNGLFAVHYLVVITLNILLFGGVRFCIQRFYVFRSST
jgi:hypothetical protein